MHNSLYKVFYFIDKFEESEIQKLNKKIHIIYRNYKEKYNIDFIKKIKHFCKKRGNKFYLANNIDLAIKLNLDGVYIPAFNQKILCKNYKIKKNFLLLGSAHNRKEIIIKEKQRVDYIFLSPLFKIKKTKKRLGIFEFLKIKKYTKTKIVALGGINKINYTKLFMLNICGYASISFIKKKFNIN